MDGLAPIDGWALLAIQGKTLAYATALLAMGGTLFLVTFGTAPSPVLRLARRVTVFAALLGIAILGIRFGIRAARISGMGVAGATDPMMLGIVWESPLGSAAIWRTAGLVLIAGGLLIRRSVGHGAAVIGAILIAASYTMVGHALGAPRWVLAGLLVVHLLTVAFWVGAFIPLHRAAAHRDGADLLHRFGHIAAVTVAALVIAGGTFAYLMTGSVSGLLGTAYGWTLIGKLAVVAGLLALAARNKLRWVPALAAGEAGAAAGLRRSIRLEILAVVLILYATATLTSVTTPPVNL